jgi:RNA polymerase sigma-70 factor, ECF subfamily
MSSAASSIARAHPQPLAPTSRRFLSSARRGDSSALGELLRRSLPQLRRWTHGRLPVWARSAADTSDLVQDAILRTLGRRDALEPQGRRALAAYLRTAVRHRICDEHRRIGRRGTASALPDDLTSADPSPLDRAVVAEMETQYRAALESLGSRDRELIVAHVELNYTHEQLGCMIGRSSNAARMALHRAIGRLAEVMRDR